MPDGGKDLIPLSYCLNSQTGEMRWKWRSFSKPRPIYGLEKLAKYPNAQVIVIEGEKACDKAQERYEAAGIPRDKLITVAWPGGGKAVKHVDWSPLAGRNVGLWPDADQKPYVDTHKNAGQLMPFIEQPGTVCMMDIASRLEGIAIKVKFIMPPANVPDGWDLADDLPEGFGLLAHTKASAMRMADFLQKHAPKQEDTPPWEEPAALEQPAENGGVEHVISVEAAPAKKRRTPDDAPVYSQKTPMKTARGMINRVWDKDGRRTIHRAGGSFFTWSGTNYIEDEDEAVRAAIYHHLEGARCFIRDKDGELSQGTLAPFNPDSANVSKVLDALCAAAQVPGGRPQECWLDGRAEPAAKEVISVANGLLHMPTRELLPHDPAFFTLNSLPFDYSPDAREPVEWLRFLEGLWPGDPDSIALLQRWMGYLLSASTSLQKMMLLIGPPRSGKGTIMRVMKALLGEANVAGPRLSAFANNFGLEPLIGKRAAIVGDARLSGKIDQGEIVGSLLSITGEDTLTVDRKNRSAWSGVLPVRITICTNEMPRLQDASGALASRFLILQMERSFLGQEDHGLGERIEGELPAILKWALDGWDALQREGRFPEPAASKAAIGALGELTSPIRAFVAEKCELDPVASTPCQDMFDAWQVWCKLQGRDHPGNLQSFGRDLAAAIAGLKVSQPRNGDGPRRRVYEGIRMRDSDVENLLTVTYAWDCEKLEFIRVVDERAGLGAGITLDEHINMMARDHR